MRCVDKRCKGVYKRRADGITAEVGGYPQTLDLSEHRCDECGRTVAQAYYEEVEMDE